MDLAQEVNELANLNQDDSKAKIEFLEGENTELVQARQAQMEKINKMMEDEIEVELNSLEEKVLPEDITAQQITNLIKIIK